MESLLPSFAHYVLVLPEDGPITGSDMYELHVGNNI
jgi:hypothetical protein